MTIDVFKLKEGMWTFPKNPADEAWYGVDLSDLLPAGVTVSSLPKEPTADVLGVVLLDGPRIQDNVILAKLGGLNVNDDATPADNTCVFGFYLSTGEYFTRSIHFSRKDK